MSASVLVSLLACAAIAAWAFWRLNVCTSHGQWSFKLSVLGVFASAVSGIVDALAGDRWTWDSAALLVALAAYLAAGYLRTRRARVRR